MVSIHLPITGVTASRLSRRPVLRDYGLTDCEAQHELQLANVEAARAVVASTTASSEQNGRDLARERRLLESGSSSTEASEKLATSHAQLEAQLH